MTAARNLAIRALIAITNQLERVGDTRPHKDGQFIDDAREAIAALEAETGEPVAWIDPRDLAVLTCPEVEEFGARRFAGVSGRPSGKNTLPLYTAPPPAVPQPSQAPDMFWDADNPECYGNDIQEIISEYGPGEVVKIDCAKSLPSISVLVSADSDGEGLTYEVSAAAPGAPA